MNLPFKSLDRSLPFVLRFTQKRLTIQTVSLRKQLTSKKTKAFDGCRGLCTRSSRGQVFRRRK